MPDWLLARRLDGVETIGHGLALAVGGLGLRTVARRVAVPFLAIVRGNTDRLITLINDLLDVSRIEAGKVDLQMDRLDVAELVRTVATALRLQIEAKKQTLVLELDRGPIDVCADRDRLVQVLSNLVSNAHKYTPTGGRIVVTASIDIGRARVDVRDSGIGMTSEEQAKLFTKFFRATNRATNEVGGTGLGLVITRSLVEMHGGEMRVASAPGVGSTFSFLLPAAAPA